MKKVAKIILKIVKYSLALICLLMVILLAAIPISKIDFHPPESIGDLQEHVVFTNANIVTLDRNKVLFNKNIIVKEGEIISISDDTISLPPNIEKIDAKGKFIMPGLVDMHAHVFDRSDLALYLSYGVTTVRNMMGFPMHLKWKEQIATGKYPGSKLITASPVLNSGNDVGPFHKNINTAEEGVNAVNDYSEKGYDFIKIYDGLQAEQFDGIVSEADEKGIVVAGHLPYDVDIEVLLNSNFNSFEHVEELLHFIDEEKTEKGTRHLAKQLKIAGKTVTINLLAFNRIYKTVMEGQAYFDQLERKGINPLIIFIGEKQLSEYVHAGPKYKALTQIKYEAMQNFARILTEENVDVVLGTDSGPNLIPAGSSVLEEMKLLQEAGLSNRLILKSATAAVAKVRNQSNSGQIAIGKAANFVLLDENPLQNINTFNFPFGVLNNNIWYDKENLQKLRKLGQEKSTIYMTLGRFFDHLIRL